MNLDKIITIAAEKLVEETIASILYGEKRCESKLHVDRYIEEELHRIATEEIRKREPEFRKIIAERVANVQLTEFTLQANMYDKTKY